MRSYKIIVTLQCVSAVSPDCGTKIQRKIRLNWVKTPKRAQNASQSHRRAVILHRETGVDAVLRAWWRYNKRSPRQGVWGLRG